MAGQHATQAGQWGQQAGRHSGVHRAVQTLLLQPCYISRHNALAAPHLQWSTGWPARQLPCEPLVMEPVTVLAGHVAMAALAFTYSCVFGILALSPALNAAAPSSG